MRIDRLCMSRKSELSKKKKNQPKNFCQLKRYKEVDEIYQIFLYFGLVKARKFE